MDTVIERTSETATDFLDRVRGLQDTLRAASAEIEETRQLPPRIAELLREAGVFQMAVPRNWGGPELDFPTIARAIEVLAEADASAAWCVMIGSDTGFASAFLDDAVGRSVFKDPSQATAFVANPTGVATASEGGFRVSGRWSFASGCTHSPVYCLNCVVMTETGPEMLPSGIPQLRVAVMEASKAQVIDTWTTTGLRGSGSHDVAVTDVFVPTEHTFDLMHGSALRDGPLYRHPTLFTLKMGALPLGVARAAIDDLLQLAESKRAIGATASMKQEGWFQAVIAEAEIAYGQARAFYYAALDDFWRETLDEGIPSRITQAKVHAAQIGALTRCTEVVDEMYRAAGSAGIYARGTLDRRLRDIHAMGQHIVFHRGRRLAELGSEFLGLPREGIFIR